MDRNRDLAQGLSRIENNTFTALFPRKTTVIDGDTAQNEITGPFFAITALSDATIDSSECTTNITSIPATLLIPKGVTIYGNFTSIELDSGILIAYSK
jgi:hypothetical protein